MPHLTSEEIQNAVIAYENGEMDEQEKMNLFSELKTIHSEKNLESFELVPGVHIVEEEIFFNC